LHTGKGTQHFMYLTLESLTCFGDVGA